MRGMGLGWSGRCHELAAWVGALAVASALMLWGASSAAAGGPTSVLVVSPESRETAALYYSDEEYGELERLLGAPGAGDRDQPPEADLRAARQINVTWMAHDCLALAHGRQHPRPDDADQERRRRDGDRQPARLRRARLAHRRFGVSAMGDAKNLQGGTLLVTPLFGADGQIYALGQGPVAIGGFSAQGEAASVTRGVPTAGPHLQWRHRGKRHRLQAGQPDQPETVAAQSRPHHRHPHRQGGQRLSGRQHRRGHRSVAMSSWPCRPIIPAA